jgi:hypothetical protein
MARASSSYPTRLSLRLKGAIGECASVQLHRPKWYERRAATLDTLHRSFGYVGAAHTDLALAAIAKPHMSTTWFKRLTRSWSNQNVLSASLFLLIAGFHVGASGARTDSASQLDKTVWSPARAQELTPEVKHGVEPETFSVAVDDKQRVLR